MVEPDFGAPDGTPITNKNTILYVSFVTVLLSYYYRRKRKIRDIDRALGVNKPPDVEYIFVEPFASFTLFGRWGFALNYYGHAAVRYTLPDGTERVMNITGVPGLEMVHFLKAEDYLFGVKDFHGGAQQGGIYNRNMIGVRIENVDPDQILDLNHYYESLQRRQKKGLAKFSLVFGYFWNTIGSFVPYKIAERGNCARWTSKGLYEVGLIDYTTMWPKRVFVDLFESHGLRDPDNVHVVSYRRVKHAKPAYGKPASVGSGVMPLHPVTNFLYWNLERFANVIVEVPEGTMTATVTVNENPARPSWWRYNKWVFYLAAGVVLSVVSRKSRLAQNTAKNIKNMHSKLMDRADKVINKEK